MCEAGAALQRGRVGKARHDSAACSRDRAGTPVSSSQGFAEATPCPGWSVPMGRGLTRVAGDTGHSGGFQLPMSTGTHPESMCSIEYQLGSWDPWVRILDWPDTLGESHSIASVSLGFIPTACQCSPQIWVLEFQWRGATPRGWGIIPQYLSRGCRAHRGVGAAAPSSGHFHREDPSRCLLPGRAPALSTQVLNGSPSLSC